MSYRNRKNKLHLQKLNKQRKKLKSILKSIEFLQISNSPKLGFLRSSWNLSVANLQGAKLKYFENIETKTTIRGGRWVG